MSYTSCICLLPLVPQLYLSLCVKILSTIFEAFELSISGQATPLRRLKPQSEPSRHNNNNSNNNNHNDIYIYSAVIVAEPLREFTRFMR